MLIYFKLSRELGELKPSKNWRRQLTNASVCHSECISLNCDILQYDFSRLGITTHMFEIRIEDERFSSVLFSFCHLVASCCRWKPRQTEKCSQVCTARAESNDNCSVPHPISVTVSWSCFVALSWSLKDAHWNYLFFFSVVRTKTTVKLFMIDGKQKVDCLALNTLVKTSRRKTMQAHGSFHRGIQEELDCHV